MAWAARWSWRLRRQNGLDAAPNGVSRAIAALRTKKQKIKLQQKVAGLKMKMAKLIHELGVIKLGLAIVTSLLLAGCGGAVTHDKSDFSGLVDIGNGRSIYIECRGTGSPTVVFVSGLLDRAETWSTSLKSAELAVLPAIAKTNRVCAYDRPGTVLLVEDDFEKSRSNAVDQPITLEEPVADLRRLLTAIGETDPYVLVGHSAGGAFAKYYANKFPENVSGLVLVDYLPYPLRKGLTDKGWDIWKKLNSPTAEALADYREQERLDHQKSFEQDSAAAPLKKLPLIVLSSDAPFDFETFVRSGRLTEKEAEELSGVLFPVILAARAGLVAAIPGAKHIAKTNSGHYIHQEQPKLVTDSVREVIATVRKASS